MKALSPLKRHRLRLGHQLSWQAEVLLDILRIFGPLTIMQLIAQGIDEEVGSPATLHKAIKTLREAWLVADTHSDDGRVVMLQLTDHGLNYLKGDL